VLEAVPAGLGFEEAALEVVKMFKLKPVDHDGKPVDGRPFLTRINWNLAR